MVANTGRPRGRPRSFDEDEAIRRATDVFWEKGFDAATLDDLVAAMGVQRPTLYAVFGDKAALFIRCLDAYSARFGRAAMQAFLAPADIGSAVRAFLRASVENATGDKSPSGCLFVTVAPLVNNAQVRSYLAHQARESAAAVTSRIQASVEAGELPRHFPVESRARMVLDCSRGLVVRARIGASREELLMDADEQAALILSH